MSDKKLPIRKEVILMDDLRVVDAVLPEELVLSLGTASAPCPGDDCNDDQGGCTHDASCGQDC